MVVVPVALCIVRGQRSEVSATQFTHIPSGRAKWTHPSRVPSMAARGDRWWGLPRSRSSRCCRDDRSAAEAEARFGVGDRSSTEAPWWWLLEPLYRPDVQTELIQQFSLLLLFVTYKTIQLLSDVIALICHFKKQLKTLSKVNLYKLEQPLIDENPLID